MVYNGTTFTLSGTGTLSGKSTLSGTGTRSGTDVPPGTSREGPAPLLQGHIAEAGGFSIAHGHKLMLVDLS